MCVHLPRERAEAQADHPIADGDVRYVRPHTDDAAGHLPAQISFLHEAERTEHIPEVEPGSLDGNTNFPRFERPCGQLRHAGFVEHTRRVRRQYPIRVIRQLQALRAVACPDQPGDPAASLTVGDVVFGVGIHQVVGEIGRGRRMGRVQVDHPRLQVNRLAGHRLAEAPKRCPGKRSGSLPLQHLRAPCDEPHAL